MSYLCSENKGADQLRGYREADLRLCFRICKTLFFTCHGSFVFYGTPDAKALSEARPSAITVQPHYNAIFGVHRTRPCYK